MITNPAFPTPVFFDDKLIGTDRGLTKLEYVAALAMQGLLANANGGDSNYVRNCAEISVKCAYALLKEAEYIQTDPKFSDFPFVYSDEPVEEAAIDIYE